MNDMEGKLQETKDKKKSKMILTKEVIFSLMEQVLSVDEPSTFER